MNFSTSFLTAVLAATSTLAAPTTQPVKEVHLQRRIAKGAQSCEASDFISTVTYSITIGEPFKQSHCNSISNKIGPAFGSGLQDCNSIDGGKHMFVKFSANSGQAKKVNEILDNEFPHVNGFNCPNF